MNITLYQTLEDLENPEDVEKYGPYICRHKGAWLGTGFYFWDTHISLGHWWGKQTYGNNKYIICQAKGRLDDYCWDLHGNGEHQKELENYIDEIVEAKLAERNTILLVHVIEYMKRHRLWSYNSIRALPMKSVSEYNTNFESIKIFFIPGSKSYLDLRPAVQVCLLEKKALSLNSWSIVYPDEYIENTFA